MTSAGPTSPAGVTIESRLESMSSMSAGWTIRPPMVTSMSRLKPVPRITTRVPPVKGPWSGTNRVMAMSVVPIPPSGNIPVSGAVASAPASALPSNMPSMTESSPLQPPASAAIAIADANAILVIATPAEAPNPPDPGTRLY